MTRVHPFFTVVACTWLIGCGASQSPISAARPEDSPHRTIRLELDPSQENVSTQNARLVTMALSPEDMELPAQGRFALYLRRLIEKARIVGDLHFDAQGHAEVSVEASTSERVLAIVDRGQDFWEFLGGSGLRGQEEELGHIALRESPHRPPASCEGERLRAESVSVGSQTIDLCIRVPANYEGSTAARFSAVYVFPGMFGRPMNYFRGQQNLGTIADEMAEELGDASILVGVDTTATYGARYFADLEPIRTVLRFVDAHYRTRAQREDRATLGHSTGGFNAVSIFMRMSDDFGGAAASAPDALDLPTWFLASDGDFGSPSSVKPWIQQWFAIDRYIGGAGQMQSYQQEWSPGSPWLMEGGVLNREVFDLWNRNNPGDWIESITRIPTRLDRLKNAIYISTGRNDEFDLFEPSARFVQRWNEVGGGATFVPTDEGHFDGAMARMGAGLRYLTLRRTRSRVAPE